MGVWCSPVAVDVVVAVGGDDCSWMVSREPNVLDHEIEIDRVSVCGRWSESAVGNWWSLGRDDRIYGGCHCDGRNRDRGDGRDLDESCFEYVLVRRNSNITFLKEQRA